MNLSCILRLKVELFYVGGAVVRASASHAGGWVFEITAATGLRR